MAASTRLATLLRTWRERALLTQEQLARNSGLHVRTIRRLETGGLHPRNDSLRLLADALHLTDAERAQLIATARTSNSTGIAATVPSTGASAVIQAGQPARCTLPADQAVFVGRDKELEQIATAVGDAARAGGVIAIHAIDGMPGIGKTALAVHVAHRLTARFGDRQLFVDLYAHTPGHQPVAPGDALAELLAADGVDPRFLPSTLNGRAALWRDRMAGRRVLLVLDNATSTEQVAPLLTGSPDCLVLITSRRSLGDLPAAVPVALDVLAPDEAVAMFVRLASRAADEREVVADLVRACGYLPLAISITASLYRRHRFWTVGDLLEEVQRSTGGLLTLKAESRTLAAVFDLSYQDLPPDRQRLFRLLGLHPGVDIDPYAAAALAGFPLDEAAGHLDWLHGDHLLEEPVYRRYRMHDLIRTYAYTLTVKTDPAKVREEAVGRLLDFYQHTAALADTFLTRYTRPAATPVAAPAAAPELASEEQAAAWLRTERGNMIACVHHATSVGQHATTVGLTAGLASLLRTDGPWTQAIQLHEAAATAADRVGDRHAHSNAVHDGAVASQLAGNYQVAADLLGQALNLYQTTGDRLGHANALCELGVVRWLAGNYPAAADLLEQALKQYQAVDDQRGRANALHWLGVVRWVTGNYPAAADLLEQALSLHRALGDRHGQANALHELGVVRRLTGNYPTAADLLERALDLYRNLGHRRGQATALNWLGVIRRLTGNYPAAADLHRQALDLSQRLGNRLGQAVALNHLGAVRSQTGDHRSAAHLLKRALSMHRALGHRHGEAIASTRLAVVKYMSGDYPGAAHMLLEALAILREIGAPDDEAEALNHLATVHRLAGNPDQAQDLNRRALDIARQIQHCLEEARALDGIGRAALKHGDTTIGLSHLRQAQNIYQQLGVPEATRLAAYLSTTPQAVQSAQ